ncbi:hypothetical protein AB0451_40470 [Streptomyces sp. NPDC052000]|uniref:hypothetical protein n=1 Tax=Streptomyces sp. NPDC052000 TaxID=3155676 RepID=UPI00344E90B7
MAEQTPDRPAWGAWLKTIAGFVAPTTLLTGLLLFFGSGYTDAFYEYFGIDAATLSFSTQDFLLRSARPLYMPVGVTLAIGLIGAVGYISISAMGNSRPALPRYLRGVSLALIVCGIALFIVGLLAGLNVWSAEALAIPLLLGGGLVLVVYGRTLRFKSTGHRYPGEVPALAIVAAMISLCSFWAVQVYAQESGRYDAEYLTRHLWLRPEIVVDMAERLYLAPGHAQETALPEGGAAQHFKFRYTGLRLLAQSGNRMFVIPKGWTPARGTVMILPADTSVRVAFRPG